MYFITSEPHVPAQPFAAEALTLTAAPPLPPHPPDRTFVRVGQGWRTVYVDPTVYTDHRVAFAACREQYPPGFWNVSTGKTPRHAGRNAARWALNLKQRLADTEGAEWRLRRMRTERRLPHDLRSSDADHLATWDANARARSLLATDTEAALAAARSIPLPWYRCQTLTEIAERMPRGEGRDSTLAEALAAAATQREPNRAASVSFWPLDVIMEQGDLTWARREVERLRTLMRTEAHPFRRADGLQSIAYGPPDLVREVLIEAAEGFAACRPGWKRDRRLSFLTQRLGERDAAEAICIAGQIADGRVRRQALRRLGVPDPV